MATDGEAKPLPGLPADSSAEMTLVLERIRPEDLESLSSGKPPRFAIGIMVTQSGTLHCGCVFSVTGGGAGAYALHFGWDQEPLRFDPLDRRWRWLRVQGITEEDLTVLATRCYFLGSENLGLLRYAIKSSAPSYSEKGVLDLAGDKGLTCVSFAVAVMRSVDVDLVDQATWPIGRPGDVAVQRTLIEMLRPGDREHADSEAQYIGNVVRVRPDELSVASHIPSPPAPPHPYDRVAPITGSLRELLVKLGFNGADDDESVRPAPETPLAPPAKQDAAEAVVSEGGD